MLWVALVHPLLLATSVPSSSSIYNIVWIVAGLFAVVGGAIAAYKVAQARGVEDREFKKVVKIVLPDDDGKGGVVAALERLSSQLDTLARDSRPNGGNTKSLGDTVQRTETAVALLASKVDQHMGAVEATNAEFRLRFAAIEKEIKKGNAA